MTVLLRRAGLAALILASSLVPRAVRAVQYETAIDIETETDLYDLQSRGEITAESLETLVDLLREGVDLNTASRDELYELPDLNYEDVDAILKYRELTTITDPAALVVAGAITQEQLLHIAPFLVLRDPSGLPLSGRVKLMTAYSNDDPKAETTGLYTVSKATQYPPVSLTARAKGPLNLAAGLAMTMTRMRMGEVFYSLDKGGLAANDPAYQFNIPKYYLQWKNSMFQVLAGTFRIGFGQKLTLDNTTRSNTPNGFYPDDVLDTPSEDLKSDPRSDGIYVTRDFGWRDAFRGAAVSVRHISLGGPELSLHAFGSYATRSIYQYEIFDAKLCPDPHEAGSSSPYPTNPCKAPPVAVADRDNLKFIYATLPDIYNELAAGGNVTLNFNAGTHIGVSGYFANDYWRDTGSIVLDFQEWSNRPYGGSYGAVGLNAAGKAGNISLFGEATRTFNAMPGDVGGGGYGALGRLVADVQKSHEIEASVRYYDRRFLNPLARPLSNPDEFEGQRARNEAGLRVGYTGKPNVDWAVRANVDVSIWPENGRAKETAGLTNLDLYLRGDFLGWRGVKLSAWAQYKNRDLATGGRGQCYDYTYFSDEDGTPLPCFGEMVRFAGAASVSPLGRKLSFAAQLKYDLVDDAKYKTSFREDLLGWVQVTSQPIDALVLRWRAKYLNESIDNNEYLEQSLWTYLDVGVLPNRIFEIHGRYEIYAFLDERKSTLLRSSPIQHRFRLELEARF